MSAGSPAPWSSPSSSGALSAPVDAGREVFTFQDPEIVESSGLVVVDGLFVTTNDSGDAGRVFAVDPATGADRRRDPLVGRPDRRRGARARRRRAVWVGDIGDNTGSRDSVAGGPGPGRPRGPDGRPGDATTSSTRTARSTPRRCSRTPRPAGSTSRARTSSAAPSTPRRARLDRRRAQPAAQARVGAADRHRRRVLPRRASTSSCATTRARSSTRSPTWRRSGRSGCPTRSRARASRSPPTAACCVSSEGQFAPVLRVPLPGDVRRAMASTAASPSGSGRRRGSTAAPSGAAPAGPAAGRASAGSCPRRRRPAARVAVVPHRLDRPGRLVLVARAMRQR